MSDSVGVITVVEYQYVTYVLVQIIGTLVRICVFVLNANVFISKLFCYGTKMC